MKDTFIIRTEWFDAISELEDADQAAIFRNLFLFHSGNENLINLNNLTVKLVWKLIEPSMVRSADKYDRRCDTSAMNGRSGGRPKKGSNPEGKNLNKPNGEPIEKQKPIETLSDSDSDSDYPYTHTQSREGENFESVSSAEAEEPNPPFCAPPPFPGYPKPEDVPPPSSSIVTAIGARQYGAGKGMVTNEQVLEYWESWLPLNISGSKFYPNAHEIYLHFSNRCEQIWIAKQQSNQNAGPSAGSSGGAAAAPRSKGSSIEDLQRLKRRSTAAGAQQPGFTEAEIVE